MLAHGGITVRLRPSLRAARRLERLHDGFPALFRKIDTFDTLTIRAVIPQAATDWTAAERLLDAMAVLPVQRSAVCPDAVSGRGPYRQRHR